MVRKFTESDTEEKVLRESFTVRYFYGISKYKYDRHGLQLKGPLLANITNIAKYPNIH